MKYIKTYEAFINESKVTQKGVDKVLKKLNKKYDFSIGVSWYDEQSKELYIRGFTKGQDVQEFEKELRTNNIDVDVETKSSSNPGGTNILNIRYEL